MKFDIARQPLVPAFLTLAALAVVAMWNAGGTAADTAALAGHAAETVGTGRNAAGALAVSSPGGAAGAVPGGASRLGALDRRTADALYGHVRRTPHRTLQPLLRRNLPRHPALRGDRLRPRCRQRLSDGLRRIGPAGPRHEEFLPFILQRIRLRRHLPRLALHRLLPLVATAAAPLLVLLPLAVMLFRRTLREVTVAVAGLLLPVLTLCYVNWGAGGGFLAPVAELGSAFVAGMPLSLFLSTPVQSLVLLGAVFILDLMALLFFLSDIHALGTKPRLIFIFNISVLLLTAAVLCGPAATPGTVALAAVPSAVLLPFMFVRIHRQSPFPSTSYCSPLPSSAQFYNNLFSSNHSINSPICCFMPKYAIIYGRLKSFNCIFENEQE